LEAGLSVDQFRALLSGGAWMRFTVVLFRDEETDSYEAVVPALRNGVTFGSTINEALALAKDTAELIVADMIDSGEEIPGETEAALVGVVDVRVPVLV
jgi:predicted RNase H-like HicB family nuclease